MKLWLLRPVQECNDEENPWSPWYDKVFGFVVRADTEEEARTMADKKGGNENGEHSAHPWMDARYSTCLELLPNGDPGIVMRDFAKA